MSKGTQTTSLPLPPPAVPADYKKANEPNPQQQKMYEKVLDHFSQPEYAVPGVEDGQLIDKEKLWLSCECILRFLRATKWADANAAIKRLEDTLKWRREFGVYDALSAELVAPEAVTGKQILFGYDKERRPVLYSTPSRQNTFEAAGQVQFTVWMLERAVDSMGPGVETLDILIDCAERAKNPGLGTAKMVISILQTHYPERLGLGLIHNIPWVVNLFLKGIMPFIDPVTRLKIKTNPKVIKDGIFEPEMIFARSWGGAVEFEYEHEEYWPALVGMCEARRAEQLARWEQQGGTVGLKEWDIKGGPAECSR